MAPGDVLLEPDRMVYISGGYHGSSGYGVPFDEIVAHLGNALFPESDQHLPAPGIDLEVHLPAVLVHPIDAVRVDTFQHQLLPLHRAPSGSGASPLPLHVSSEIANLSSSPHTPTYYD